MNSYLQPTASTEAQLLSNQVKQNLQNLNQMLAMIAAPLPTGHLKTFGGHLNYRGTNSGSVGYAPDGNITKIGQELRTDIDGKSRILLVEKLPQSLANPDSVYFMFEKFGNVERVKVLHKQPTTALVQMETSAMAFDALDRQAELNKIGTAIQVKLCTKITEVSIPAPNASDHWRTKDFTMGIPQDMASIYQMNFGDMYHVNNGSCLLVDKIPEALATPNSLCNLFGFYGDVDKVMMLPNKSDMALIEMAKPHQAATCRRFLNATKICGHKWFVNFSRKDSVNIPNNLLDDQEKAKIFSNEKIHRFRSVKGREKKEKNLCSPTSMLFVSNVPTAKSEELKQYFVESGFTVEQMEMIGDGNQYLMKMGSVDDAVLALAKLHNTMPSEIGEKKGERGLYISFSNRKDMPQV